MRLEAAKGWRVFVARQFRWLWWMSRGARRARPTVAGLRDGRRGAGATFFIFPPRRPRPGARRARPTVAGLRMAGGTPALHFLSCGSGGFDWGWALVIAFFVWTRDYRAGFEILLDQEFTSARRAFLGNRLVGGRELTLRVIRAPVECVALARLLLDQFP